jgi:hypothetical protein
MLIPIAYGLYLTFSMAFTFWVGRNLHKNGRVFLLEAFKEDAAMADAVNQLLLVGFYLVNFGLVSLFLSVGTKPTGTVEAIEYLTFKIGVVLVVLGGMHFFNMKNIAKIRSKGKSPQLAPLPRG